jgi:hypothetical protein
VFTTSPGKLEYAKRLGAQEAVLWSDERAQNQSLLGVQRDLAPGPDDYPAPRRSPSGP